MCWLKDHIYKLIPEHQYVVVPTKMSFTEKTAFIKKKSLPTLPNFYGVVTLNTLIFFYLALLNMRNTLKKMAELTYAENRPVDLTRTNLRH